MKTSNHLKIPLLLLGLMIFISFGLSTVSAATPGDNSTMYVSTTGNDSWDGQSTTYNSTTGSGPKATIKNATTIVAENGTIYIANGTYYESGININKNMNIIGESQSGTIINGQKSGNSIFLIVSGVTVTVTNLTLTNGTTTNVGGAIYNGGTLTITNSTLTNNTATSGGGVGGAIYNDNTLNITNSTFTGNTAWDGGAIYNYGGSLTIENSTFTNNTADTGGAISSYEGTLNVGNSTFTGNNATINGRAIFGGAIYNILSTASVSFCQIIDNGANEIYNDQGSVTAKYNWWANNDPSTYVNSGVDVSPWLVLTVTSDNSTILVGGNSTVTADLQHDSTGTYHDPAKEGHVPDGTLITFNLSNTRLGSLNTISTTLTNGTATTMFTATSTGTENVTATVDNQLESTSVTVESLIAYVSTNGNDNYDGLSPVWNGTSGPKATITGAINILAPNGTVYITNGTYNESNIIIDKNMNIIGESQSGTIINGQKTGNSIFTIASGVTVTITNLTLTNGTAEEYGGAIRNFGNLTVNNSTFTNNNADNCGGAIYNEGNLTVGNSTFTGNTANQYGGGAIANFRTLTVGNSTFTNNSIDGSNVSGGAIRNFFGTLTVGNSTFTGNTAHNGGAIYNCGGSSTVGNSTFTGNTAYVGGAIANWYTDVSVSFCRILDNGANEIYNDAGSVTARYNWWGSNDDPSSKVSDGVDVSPWLVLTVTSDNSTILVGGNSTVTVDLQHDSTETYHDPIKEGHVPDGTTVIFNLSDTSLGSLSTISTTLTNGTATTLFTSTNSGSENVIATVDNQLLSTLITINKLNTTLIVGNVTGSNGQNVNLTATLKDENGNPLTGKTVTFTVNGKDYTAVTDSNGVATLGYTLSEAGTYTITANFGNDTSYGNSTGNATLTINPASYLYLNTTTSNKNPTVGDTFIITYKLGNNGPDNATNVTMSFQIPSGLEFVTASVDNGTWTYNAANRTITWTLSNVAVGDPYLYLTVKASGSGSYIITPTITSETFNQNTNPLTPFTVNVQAQNNNNSNGNNTNTVNAATQTISMQHTGVPLAGLALAILTIFSGMLPRRKQ
ncbi:Ig-like domain-containing protein [Methanobacterium paludis]|uniref:Conserved repeat domain protein n=1 Tax=Methanobacterium paludis (strain DSM 25820 / JCM 18151 / SWAN1) TaxID=868131 RepID=F6D742_METPW|nr:Ig-like domain repeat protein [Methanobacterium paludis]AEG18409.1 conserved repeat domain protein [Methanobacterium paludis]